MLPLFTLNGEPDYFRSFFLLTDQVNYMCVLHPVVCHSQPEVPRACTLKEL